MLPQKAYLHALAHIEGLGPKRFELLNKYFNHDIKVAWENYLSWPTGILPHSLNTKNHQLIIHFNLYKEWEILTKSDINLICPLDANYPKFLKELPDAPFALYYKGTLPQQNQQLITIVGTRNITNYGRQVIDSFIPPLVASGIGVISGLAFGIDEHCHKETLKHTGFTGAVLASGVDNITPKGNEKLGFELLDSGGCIISEFVPGANCAPGNFPRRNRLLAGLTPMTLVIEAAEKSGARITAYYALDYNREVAAIPGSIYSNVSTGCNDLIKQGAKVVTTPDEILEFYNVSSITQIVQKIDLTDDEKMMLTDLSSNPSSLDILINKTQKTPTSLLSILSSLEIKGIIKNVPGQGYCLM